jgi:serine/threonine protein phosphatase 1
VADLLNSHRETDAAVNENVRLYVIGDIHGRLDLLDGVIAAIHRDVEEHGSGALTVTLGDYIDRGPASRGVLERLVVNPFPTPLVALKGNHEALLQAFLANSAVGKHWRSLGGAETLHSYGVPVGMLMAEKDYAGAADRLRAALPEDHLSFLQSLKTSLSHGKYFLCHAGVRPGVPLESQQEEDLLWIRDEFLNSKMDFGKIVVHGHTPRPEPEVLPNRINIDTGAFATGRLTCAVLEGDRHRFLAT